MKHHLPTITFPDDDMQYIAPTWRQVQSIVFAVAEEIKNANKSFDAVVTLASGGFAGASMLKDFLQTTPVLSLGIKSYSGISEVHTPEIYQDTPLSVQGQKVLIFDDVTDSGDTMVLAEKYLEEQGIGEMSTATIFHKSRSVITPDFFGMETEAWIVFPHEVMETMKALSERWKDHSLSDEELRDRFFQLGFEEQWVEVFLKSI